MAQRSQESFQLFEEPSLCVTYAILVATADIILCQHGISHNDPVAAALCNASTIVADYLKMNEETSDFYGISQIMRNILKRNLTGDRYMLVNLQSEDYDVSNQNPPLYYDDTFVYPTRKQMQEWLQEGQVKTPLSRILNALYLEGNLDCYDMKKATYFKKISVTQASGVTERINCAAIRRALFEEPGTLPLLP